LGPSTDIRLAYQEHDRGESTGLRS